MSFEKSNGASPVNQTFIWLAEYLDSSYLSEFDYQTKQNNNFYTINKGMLSKFGLVGQGMKLYFDVNTGSFNFNGSTLDISYKTSEKEYHLTGFSINGLFDDIITYKDAYSDADIRNPNQKYQSHIHQYNFGYKKKFIFVDGLELNFQAVVCLPYNKPAYVELKIVSNKDLNGEIYMKVAGRMTERVEAPLNKDYAGVCQWAIK